MAVIAAIFFSLIGLSQELVLRDPPKDTTLPVKLVSFNASVQSKAVTLSWTTSMEKNVSHFTIQRSSTGAEYDDAGIFFTEANSETLKSYSFKDVQTGNSSILYYRLKIVDMNGKTEYSLVRVVKMG